MPNRRAFKSDESFLEKIAIGATGTRRVFEHLTEQGHQPLELERGSRSFKIWKAIKIKRVRVPDILCLRCGQRVESRAKTKIEITMSHSVADPERGWDFGLEDSDMVALVHCRKIGPSPVAWVASPLVQYAPVGQLRQVAHQGHVVTERAKGAQEGFEVRLTWPSATASAAGVVSKVDHESLSYRRSAGGRPSSIRLTRKGGPLEPLVAPGDHVEEHQILAAVVPVCVTFPCPGGAGLRKYTDLSRSTSLSDRYAAVKAIGRFEAPEATDALVGRLRDEREHIYVKVDAAAGLMRRGHLSGREFLAATLADHYLENRLEAVIVLGEVGTPDATALLIRTLDEGIQHAEIRAGAAWSLGEIGNEAALTALLRSFATVADSIKVEAARALAKLVRRFRDQVIRAFPASPIDDRPRLAWALAKAGGFRVHDLLPALVDEDARYWVAYIIGTQERDLLLPEIEELARRDPEVYFAVTVLWKIMASWVYDLEEY